MSSSSHRTDLGPLTAEADRVLAELDEQRVVSRIWRGDPSVWGGTASTPELSNRLGWLDPFDATSESLAAGADVIARARAEAERVVLLGMGGSSLAPEVMWRVLARPEQGPEFVMIDSTSPDALAQAGGNLDRTWFVVSSKSGSTLETRILFDHFYEQTGRAGDRFVAVTDPGSQLEQTAAERGCAHVFLADPTVGGRFSALTPFGMVPLAMMGHDPDVMLAGGRMFAEKSQGNLRGDNGPGWLGTVLGVAAEQGRNKLGLVLTPHVSTLGLWLEQLIAESTGKHGKGIVPVVLDRVPEASTLGPDWIFAVVTDSRDDELDWTPLAGHPVIDMGFSDPLHLGGALYYWEFATAVAGAVMGLNPFDQPNVAESKQITTAVLSGERSVDVPAGGPDEVASLLNGVTAGDYVALLAYEPPTAAGAERLSDAARALHTRLSVPVTWGFGPRYLHSTGQLHKGGPAQGAFIQIVKTPDTDVPVPGESFTFGDVFLAQADGDYAALADRNLPIVRITDAGLLR